MNSEPSKYRECELCRVAGDHLRAQGWRVVAELPFWERSVDLAATRGELVFLIEAKTSFTRRLRSQVYGALLHTNYAVALVGTKPRAEALRWAGVHGIGVWQVIDGRLVVLLEPVLQCNGTYSIARMRERMLRMPEAVTGGMPCIAGAGPAHAVEAATKEYRATHPGATWAEVWRAVPNHYVSAKSMQSAFYSNRQRRAWRDRIRAMKRQKPEACA